MAESTELSTPARQQHVTAFTSSTNRGRQPGNWSKIAAVVSVFQLFEDREEATLGLCMLCIITDLFRSCECAPAAAVAPAPAPAPRLLHPFTLDANAGGWRNLIFSPTCSSSNSHYHTSKSGRGKTSRRATESRRG